MNPLYFGNSEQPLFGMYHPPTALPARPKGVVLCNPFGDEAIKAHRAFRVLTSMLCKQRFHVLRFDYFGTGDSSGASDEGSLSQWMADIEAASDELKDTAGVTRLAWVGLRLGATLAHLAARKRRDLDKLVLWDPVLRGSDYLDDLDLSHVAYLRSEYLGHHRQTFAPQDGNQALGFPLLHLRQEIAAIDLTSDATCAAKSVVTVLSQKTEHHTRFHEQFHATGKPIHEHFIPATDDWNSDQALTSAIVPTAILETIVASLNE